jgi:hypothetical protein
VEDYDSILEATSPIFGEIGRVFGDGERRGPGAAVGGSFSYNSPAIFSRHAEVLPQL